MTDEVDDRHGAFTLDELSDYLDADRTPFRADIEGDPDAVVALDRLHALRVASRDLLDSGEPAAGDERWISSVLASIRTTAHAGRDIPVPDDDPAAHLVVTEGALRGLVRTLGDDVPGVVVRRTRFSGDVGVPGGVVDVEVTVVVTLEASVAERAEALRAHVTSVLGAHAPFTLRTVVVRVADVVVGGTP